MRFIVTVANDKFRSFVSCVRLAEQVGFDGVGIVDSPNFADVYVSAAVALTKTKSIHCGPLVTNPVTRLPSVTARAVWSLDALSTGRALIGLGVGDSAVRREGIRPATTRDVAEIVTRIRRVWCEKRDGADARVGRVFPGIIVASNGPRTLEMAGQLADAVLLGGGISDEVLGRSIEHVHAGIEKRLPELGDVEIWVFARCALGDEISLESEVKPLLASGANYVFQSEEERNTLTISLRNAVDELRRRYDYRYHGLSGPNPNSRLIDELGITEYLIDRFTIFGEAAAVAARCRDLALRGVGGIVIPAIVGRREQTIEQIGRQVITRYVEPA